MERDRASSDRADAWAGVKCRTVAGSMMISFVVELVEERIASSSACGEWLLDAVRAEPKYIASGVIFCTSAAMPSASSRAEWTCSFGCIDSCAVLGNREGEARPTSPCARSIAESVASFEKAR